MSNFKIFPVIDILNSTAVHAIKGERDNYQPLKSPLFNTSEPFDIVRNLKEKFNIKQFYIADLDAIIKQKPNFRILKKILEIENIEIIVDPGIKSINDLKLYSEFKIESIILGLETIQKIKTIKESFKIFNKNKLIISIDMFKERIITKIDKLKNLTPLTIVRKLEKMGIKNIILLDIFKVGQKIGGIPLLYLKIKKNFNGNVLVGGGIKNLNDVLFYYEKGFSGVLIGTAIYDGTINLNKLNMVTKINQ
ncbi:MAG: HisA/HisF-related TIM barrel protein [Promethearchaeota archaeon]|jgi:phosphoribosylformimino-5-aminoimidazole carboxamide ribotide isomerase